MRLKELRGLPVIDPTAARRVGTVADYQVDPAARRVAAIDVAGVENGQIERVLGEHIRRVGQHAVMLMDNAPAGSLSAEVNQYWLDASILAGLEVLGDDGNRIGQLTDGVFDQDSLEIQSYMLEASLWEQLLGNRGRIEPDKVHSCSRELMIVNTGRAPRPGARAEEPPSTSLPLKSEDRLPTPDLIDVQDGKPVGARRD